MATATKTDDSAIKRKILKFKFGGKKFTNGQKRMVRKLQSIGVNTDEILLKVIGENNEPPTGTTKIIYWSNHQKEKLTQLLRDAVLANGIENLKLGKTNAQRPTVPLGKSPINTKRNMIVSPAAELDAHVAKKLKVDDQTSEQSNRRLKVNKRSASENNMEPSIEQIMGEIQVLEHPGTVPDSESEDN